MIFKLKIILLQYDGKVHKNYFYFEFNEYSTKM